MIEIPYEREKVKQYAKKWAYTRNPNYYNYDAIGGDCTNFASQCIYAGSGIMNFTKDTGWYYKSANQKAPSWTGVEFLYRFLIKNKGIGPFGKLVTKQQLEIGDIVQLSFDGKKFVHTLVVIEAEKDILVSTHTFDSYKRNLNTYTYQKSRNIHIEGVRKW